MRTALRLTTAAFTLGAASIAGAHPGSEPHPYPTIPLSDSGEPALQVGGIDIGFGGFIKLDALYSRFSDGDVASLDQGRDYFRPASIPVAAAGADDGHAFLDLHAKDTRFWTRAEGELAGHTLSGYIELDFRSSPGAASETVTNAYSPRVRRAFVTWDKWLLGQEWSLMRNLDANPDHIDDIRGPSEALVVVRQPQLRWTSGPVQVALENAETTVMPRTGTVAGATPVTATFVTGDAWVPDLTARYTWKPGKAVYTVAAIVRQLSAEDAATGGDAPNDRVDGHAMGFGLNVAGKVPTWGADDLRFAVTAGEGIGRYAGLSTIADAVVDEDGGLEPISVFTYYATYRHPWTARWRSNFTLAALEASNPVELTGTGVTSNVYSAHANILFEPVQKLTLGLEFTHAVRELENDQSGDLDRLQASAKFEF